MKNYFVRILMLLLSSLFLISCGGGSSSDDGSSTTTPQDIYQPTDSGISYVPDDGMDATQAQSFCDSVMSASVESLSVDLSNSTVRAVHDMLQAVDPTHGYELFMRNHNNFLKWLSYNTSIATAIHEANHDLDFTLQMCDPNSKFKYFSFGEVHITDLGWPDTQNYSIVEETIPTVLKNAFRYDTYIEGAKSVDNNFKILLDELNAYTGDAWFQINFAASGKTPTTQDYTAYGTFQIDGMIDFMIYMEYYLKSARLNYPDTYATIQSQLNTLTYINMIWQKAEEALVDAYPYIVAERGAQSIFFGSPYGAGTSGLDRLKVAYSDDALDELDRLGIAHQSYNYWSSTYFAYNYSGTLQPQEIIAKIRYNKMPAR